MNLQIEDHPFYASLTLPVAAQIELAKATKKGFGMEETSETKQKRIDTAMKSEYIFLTFSAYFFPYQSAIHVEQLIFSLSDWTVWNARKKWTYGRVIRQHLCACAGGSTYGKDIIRNGENPFENWLTSKMNWSISNFYRLSLNWENFGKTLSRIFPIWK